MISIIDDNKVYEIKDVQIVNIKSLDECKFFQNGIITYNNQKINYLDFNSDLIWKNETGAFSDNIYVDDGFIFRCSGDSIEVISKSQSFVISEISGDIINVSREKNRTIIITSQKNGYNSLYMMDENNDKIVDNKKFQDMITDVSVSDKSEGYCIVALRNEDGKYINRLSFNLMDNLELWSNDVENGIIIETEMINNNVLAIGTENIYLFNSNGKMMWKNSNYNKIKNYLIDEKNEKVEFLSYNYEGKVKKICKAPNDVNKIKVFSNKIYLYSENIIYMLHDDKFDKLYDVNNEQIVDFYIENNNLFILLKDKLIKGQIS